MAQKGEVVGQAAGEQARVVQQPQPSNGSPILEAQVREDLAPSRPGIRPSSAGPAVTEAAPTRLVTVVFPPDGRRPAETPGQERTDTADAIRRHIAVRLLNKKAEERSADPAFVQEINHSGQMTGSFVFTHERERYIALVPNPDTAPEIREDIFKRRVAELERLSSIEGPKPSELEHLITYDSNNLLIINKFESGQFPRDMTEEQISAIPKEHLESALAAIEWLNHHGFSITGDDENFLYDPQQGFKILDVFTERGRRSTVDEQYYGFLYAVAGSYRDSAEPDAQELAAREELEQRGREILEAYEIARAREKVLASVLDHGILPSTQLEQRGISQEKNELPELVIDHKVLWHGSATADITKLEQAQEATVGNGIYFVDNPKNAAEYARFRAEARGSQTPTTYQVDVENVKLVNLDNQQKLDEIMRGYASVLKQRLLSPPADVSMLEPFLLEQTLQAIKNGIKVGQVKRGVGAFPDLFTAYLQDLGYDGLKTLEAGVGDMEPQETYLLFDPQKVTNLREHGLANTGSAEEGSRNDMGSSKNVGGGPANGEDRKDPGGAGDGSHNGGGGSNGGDESGSEDGDEEYSGKKVPLPDILTRPGPLSLGIPIDPRLEVRVIAFNADLLRTHNQAAGVNHVHVTFAPPDKTGATFENLINNVRYSEPGDTELTSAGRTSGSNITIVVNEAAFVERINELTSRGYEGPMGEQADPITARTVAWTETLEASIRAGLDQATVANKAAASRGERQRPSVRAQARVVASNALGGKIVRLNYEPPPAGPPSFQE